MERKIKALLFQAPAIILLIGSFLLSIYSSLFGIQGYESPIGAPILFAIILGLYFWGRKLEKSPYPY